MFVTVRLNVAAIGIPMLSTMYLQPAFTVQDQALALYNVWGGSGRSPALTSGSLYLPRDGWLTFAVPAAVAGQLHLIVPPGSAVRLY